MILFRSADPAVLIAKKIRRAEREEHLARRNGQHGQAAGLKQLVSNLESRLLTTPAKTEQGAFRPLCCAAAMAGGAASIDEASAAFLARTIRAIAVRLARGHATRRDVQTLRAVADSGGCLGEDGNSIAGAINAALSNADSWRLAA